MALVNSPISVRELIRQTEVYAVTRPLSPELYRAVLDYAVGRSTRFLLVVRDSLGLSSGAMELLDRLGGFLRKDYRSDKWPGTELRRGTARILEYVYTSESKGILQQAAGDFYDWRQPNLPEDLCLRRPSGAVWMATISHEGDAFFVLEAGELTDMLAHVPAWQDYL